MNWALVVAVAWVVVLLPAGYLIGAAIRRSERRSAAAALRRRMWHRAGRRRLSAGEGEHRGASAPGRTRPMRGASAPPRVKPLQRRDG